MVIIPVLMPFVHDLVSPLQKHRAVEVLVELSGNHVNLVATLFVDVLDQHDVL